MNRLTPEREKSIRAREFFGIAKKVIIELLYEIDELRRDMISLQTGFDEDEEEEQPKDDYYQDFRSIDIQRDKLRSVLKTAIKNDTAKKFFSASEEK